MPVISQKHSNESKASSLTDAKNGTFLVDLDGLNKKTIERLGYGFADLLFSALNYLVMSRQTISIGDENCQLSLSPCVAFWGYTNLREINHHSLADPEFASTFVVSCKEIIRPLIRKFDLVLNLKASSLQQHYEPQAEHILNGQLQSNIAVDHPEISQNDFQRYINSILRFDVRITDECSAFLQGYFTTLRQRVGSIAIGKDSMFSTVELCMRDQTLIEDTLVSIMLVEEAAAFAFGVSCLGFTTLPEDQENISKLFHGSEDNGVVDVESHSPSIDEVMARFHEHVLAAIERNAETHLEVKQLDEDLKKMAEFDVSVWGDDDDEENNIE
ncbi:hypothetical protein HDU97_002202 [Phlyctochytrium planicorne]|nr:hypothetical protein HDU97_002202 [Phlyctochytrium planicorne]